MTKVVLVSIPRLSPAPQLGPRIICDTLRKQNIECEIFDANINFYQKFLGHKLWIEIERWGIELQDRKQVRSEVWYSIQDLMIDWVNHIRSLESTHVGISFLTYESRNWGQWLCYFLRKYLGNVKIFIGGKGINVPGIAKADFAQNLLDWDLCDAFFNGESENEVVKWILGKQCIVNNVDSYVAFVEKNKKFTWYDNSPYTFSTDWNDVPIFKKNISAYKKNTEINSIDQISRAEKINLDNIKEYRTISTFGCVKKCTFCDVHLLRPQWDMRSAKNLFDELTWAIGEHGVRQVKFSDNMINGSNSQFLSWMEMLANWLEQKAISDFCWSSPFSLKNKKSFPSAAFDLMHRTGAVLNIGIDHFSDPVLDHMKKLYKQDDIFWFFEQTANTDIKFAPLQLVPGYPTETLEDFEILCQGVRQLQQYTDQILTWDFGTGCTIPVGSTLSTMPGMHINQNQGSWFYEDNPTLTISERKRRLGELEKIAKDFDLIQPRSQATSIRINKWLT